MQGFFTTMMRYIDSGDDVGVALSPQLMFNVVPDCDIFNHQNVHFWEMMQPGMDALGFISLTGSLPPSRGNKCTTVVGTDVLCFRTLLERLLLINT